MNEEQKAFLIKSVKRYVWWKNTDEAMLHTQRILAQVMNIGTWNDMCKLVELFSREELLHVLNTAEIGQFNERSWHFWHNRFSDKVPTMPERVMP